MCPIPRKSSDSKKSPSKPLPKNAWKPSRLARPEKEGLVSINVTGIVRFLSSCPKSSPKAFAPTITTPFPCASWTPKSFAIPPEKLLQFVYHFQSCNVGLYLHAERKKPCHCFGHGAGIYAGRSRRFDRITKYIVSIHSKNGISSTCAMSLTRKKLIKIIITPTPAI